MQAAGEEWRCGEGPQRVAFWKCFLHERSSRAGGCMLSGLGAFLHSVCARALKGMQPDSFFILFFLRVQEATSEPNRFNDAFI